MVIGDRKEAYGGGSRITSGSKHRVNQHENEQSKGIIHKPTVLFQAPEVPFMLDVHISRDTLFLQGHNNGLI